MYSITKVLARGAALSVLVALALFASNNGSQPVQSQNGNFQCYSGYARTIGFWSNRNGRSILCAEDPDWRNDLNSFCLVDNAGDPYAVPTTGDCNSAHDDFRNWLLGANASNMANMLSAQMAGTILNLLYGDLNFIEEPWVFFDGYYQKLWDLIDEASDSICDFPITTAGHPERARQEALKDLFDGINNNEIDVCEGLLPPYQCVYGLGRTLGFWSNPNGKNTLDACHEDWAAILNGFHLRDGSGADVVITDHASLNSFLLSATATNMANMLSAQMAAVILDVICGKMSEYSDVYVFWDGKLQDIWDVFAEADDLLKDYPYTVDASAERTKQEALKDFFDAINNNNEPVYVPANGPVGPCIGTPGQES
jgi:hypothetical protein